MQNKKLTGSPLPPPGALEAWLRDKLKAEPDVEELVTTVREVFLEDTVASDVGLARPVRARLYKLFSLGIVRTQTVNTKREDNVFWDFHHWILKAPPPGALARPAPPAVTPYPPMPQGARPLLRARGPPPTLPRWPRGGTR